MALAAFAIPVWQVIVSLGALTGTPDSALAIYFMQRLADSAPIYPMVAFGAGVTLAITTWYDDIQGKHVYALSLPLPRWYYVALRLAVGMTSVLVMVSALWLAAMFAALLATLPPGLHAYPGGLAVRFALATTLWFTAAFAIASASERTQRVVLLIAAALILGSLALAATGVTAPGEALFDWVSRWPGITDTFAGRWLLFDV
jgi:hypothetical protein